MGEGATWRGAVETLHYCITTIIHRSRFSKKSLLTDVVELRRGHHLTLTLSATAKALWERARAMRTWLRISMSARLPTLRLTNDELMPFLAPNHCQAVVCAIKTHKSIYDEIGSKRPPSCR